MSANGSGEIVRTPVLIAGRGPVGMTLALRLAGFGVPSLIVDPMGWEIDPGSKALCMQQESMEILDQVGVGGTLGSQGVYWPLGRTYFRGTEVTQVRFPPVPASGFPPFVNYPQRDTEALLLDKVRDEPLITKRLGWGIAEVLQSDTEVTAILDGPERITVKADYIVGCDGSRSTVRKQFGFVFSGTSYAANFLLCDIRARLDFPNERRLHFDPAFNPGHTVLVHPCPDDVWHIDWQVGAEPVDVEAERASGRVDERIRAVIDDKPYELLWLTTYTFRSLIADRMRKGRAMLAGDAAHLFAPYGARGLNSGLADAEDLAWRLALVERHGADTGLLDGYDTERMAAARENFAITDETARFMAPPTAWARMKRTAVLWASRHLTWARGHINAGRFYQPTRLPGNEERCLAGAILPDAPCTIGGRDGRLRDLVGKGFLLLGVGADLGRAGDLCHCVAATPADAFPCASAVLAETDIAAPDGIIAVVMAAKAANAYRGDLAPGATRILIVRPDAYVASAIDITANEETEAARMRILDALVSVSGQAKFEPRRSDP